MSAHDNLNKVAVADGEIIFIRKHSGPGCVSPDGWYYDEIRPQTDVRVDLRPAKGSFIRVEIALPDKWNGRFVGLGNSGAAGGLPSGNIYSLANQGFAAATTDMGTSTPDPLRAGIGNLEVWKDFGHRAAHLMTLAAKQFIRARYGRDARYSYFIGSSTGGQQALSLAQRHPEDYDGIFAEVPAHCRVPLHAYFLWTYQCTHNPDGSTIFTPGQEQRYIDSALMYFAAREKFPHALGVFVSEPRWNDADRQAVLELAARRDPTLTPKHLAMLKRMQDGPVNSRTGERIFNGLPPATHFDPACGNLYLFNWVFGENTDYMKLDFDKDIDRYLKTLSPDLNAENPNLEPFRRHGGKLLIYSGTADSCVPYHATLDYYERVVEHFGSPEEVRKFFLFYILPGREHGNGPGIQKLQDAFGALMRWREQDIVPELKGIRPGENGYEVPLYPYPMQTGADGKAVESPRGGVERVAARYLKQK